jgi:hypothetical protein
MRTRLISVIYLAILIIFGAQPLKSQQVTRRRPLFQILTQSLPSPVIGQPYDVPLKATGGQRPYHWSIQGKPLPQGLELDADTGEISGTPVSNREFSVLVQLTDSSNPPLIITKQLIAGAGAPLTAIFTDQPHVHESNIAGTVRVSNGSHDTINMTVIVVAVNEIGKAFALRYERLNLPPGTDSPDLTFDVFEPSGQYSVHLDAVGEVASKNAIYRDRREVDGLIVK